jgi:hypothetical protein
LNQWGSSVTKQQVKTVLGFCPTHAHAEEAVDKLRLSGFRNTDVSALLRDGGNIFGSVLSWPAGYISNQEICDHKEWIDQGGIVLYVRCSNIEWETRAERVLHRSMATAGAC